MWMLKITKPYEIYIEIQICVFIWSNKRQLCCLTGSHPLLQHNSFTLVNISHSLHWTWVCYFQSFSNIPRCYRLHGILCLLYCLRFKACSFHSCSPQAKRIVVWHPDVRFSDPVVSLSGNMASASLPSVGHVCCVWRETELEKEREHLYGGVTQGISSHPQSDLQGRWWVPGVGLWRQKRAQAWGSLLWLPLVEVVSERRGPSTLLQREKGGTLALFWFLSFCLSVEVSGSDVPDEGLLTLWTLLPHLVAIFLREGERTAYSMLCDKWLLLIH